MKIKELFGFEDDIYIDRRLDRERRLIPTCTVEQITKESILIYPKRLGKREYTLPKFESTLPYAVIAGEDISCENEEVPLIRVRDPRRCASFIFSKEYGIDYGRMRIIGITGTNGKTTTSEMLFSILREAGYNVGFIGTGEIRINDVSVSENDYSMTTPDPDLLYKSLGQMQASGCEYVVMEVSSHSIALSKIAPVKFKCAVFTNLSEEHMDFHENMESYYNTKLSLFSSSEYGIFNLDDRYSRRASEEKGMMGYRVGIIDTSGDSYITDYKSLGLDGSEYYYREKGLIFKIKLGIGGAYNVYNSLLAAKCAITLGIKPCIVKKALSNIKQIRGRLNLIRSDITVAIDYAHTPQAFKEVLYFLKSSLIPGQSLITVFGCGGERDKTKRAVMGKTAEDMSDFVIVTEDNSRSEDFSFICDMITSGMRKRTHTVIESRSEAIRCAILSANEGDLVAIIGKGHEKYIIDKQGKRHFDESEIIKSALLERKSKK